MVEDFARRKPLFLWAAFEWLLRRIEGSGVHAYTLAEAKELCQQVGLHVAREKVFKVDWFWYGWAVRASRSV